MVEEVGTLQIHKRNVGCFLQPCFELSHLWTLFDLEKPEKKYKILSKHKVELPIPIPVSYVTSRYAMPFTSRVICRVTPYPASRQRVTCHVLSCHIIKLQILQLSDCKQIYLPTQLCLVDQYPPPLPGESEIRVPYEHPYARACMAPLVVTKIGTGPVTLRANYVHPILFAIRL